jgi:hypothetical protein
VSADGEVYLIREAGTSWAKVGYTSSGGRLDGLQTGNPRELVWVRSWAGDPTLEVRLQSLLEARFERGRGEWFSLPELAFTDEAFWRELAPWLYERGARRAPRVPVCVIFDGRITRLARARREAWEAAGRELRADQELTEVCGEARCVSVAHLEIAGEPSGHEPRLGVAELQALRRSTASGRLPRPPA